MTFTKEQLIERCKNQADYAQAIIDLYPDDVGAAESRRIAEIALEALAGMEAEPVAYVDPHAFQNFSVYRDGETDNKRMGREWMWANPDAGLIPVYAAPQPLTTAERAELQEYRNAEFMPKNLDRALTIMGVALPESKEEFNLQAERWMQRLIDRVIRCESELSPQSGAVKDGWVMVPVEPTEDMIVEGFESEPDESFSDEKDWEAYDAMSGCQQAAHRAKLCWAAMISVAPKI